MSHPVHRLSLVEQTAAHLREGFQSGRWVGDLPGVLPLAEQLVVSKHIVRLALELLVQEGWIEDCGVGRRRRIVKQHTPKLAHRPLRIGILLYEPFENDDAQTVKVLLGIRYAIETSGHICVFAKQSLTELDDNLTKISRLVKAVEADAWIVFAASRVVLEWFVTQSLPVYAYSGRYHDLPVAASGSNLAPALESAVNQLVNLGHKRIVLLAPTVLRKPTPIPIFIKYLSFLESHGIAAADYNLPHFDDTPAGFEHCLDSLFHLTPPTALLVQNSLYMSAALSFLARRGLQVPRDVSVICIEMESVFLFNLPSPAHFDLPVGGHISHIGKWINDLANGRPHQRQVLFDAPYIPGGTVGPAKK